ncbi:MAG: glycosyltransferase [Chloroflexi bacterium]|nr:glycosyltransferase [Chloroflexota bacterium]
MLLSVFLRVLDEAEMLPGCLRRLEGVADEVILVDSGSSDATVRIALDWGARVLRWKGGSASQEVLFTPEGPIYNLALDACQGDWVLLTAADERLCQRAMGQLRAFLAAAPQDNVALWGVHLVLPGHYARAWLSHIPGRLVRRTAFRFDPQAVMDQSFPLVGNGQVARPDMAILHHYYHNRHAKLERYYRLKGKPLDTVAEDIRREQAAADLAPWPSGCGPTCARCFLNGGS